MKKILLICKEQFASVQFRYAEYLIERDFCAELLWIHPEESILPKGIYNRETYYKSHETQIKSHSLDVLQKYYNYLENDSERKRRLKEVECQLSPWKTIGQIQMTSQLLSTYYHNRTFFRVLSDSECDAYFLGLFDSLEVLFSKEKYDYVLDLEEGELGRSIINTMSEKWGVNYLTLDYTRVEDYKFLTHDMGVSPMKLKNKNTVPNDAYKEAEEWLEEIRSKQDILPQQFRETHTSINYRRSNIVVFKEIIGKTIYFLSHWRDTGIFRYRYKEFPFAHPFKHWWYIMKIYIRKPLFRLINFDEIDLGNHYIFVPLHVIPESSVFVRSDLYLSELPIIEQLGLSVPSEVIIYVKEHPAMIGERSFQFYKKLRTIRHVRMVNPYEYSSTELIKNAKGVVTISGSAAFEATLFEVKAAVFGKTLFENINLVNRINNFSELVSWINNLDVLVDNNVLDYLAEVFHKGVRLDLVRLKFLSEGDLDSNEEMEFKVLLRSMDRLYGLHT